MFNSQLSGATLSTIVLDQKENWLYCAGVGDSRVQLVSLDRNWVHGKLAEETEEAKKLITITNLTKDHWPSDQREEKRIKKMGGDIRPSMKAMT